MKKSKLVILLIFSGSVIPCAFVLGEPYDELHSKKVNIHIEGALPETISFGNLLPDRGENEIVIGTPKKTLIIMDHELKTIFSINLSSNAKKTIISQMDENIREKMGLFVLTENGEIGVYEGYGTRTLLLSFLTPLSDFIVINADEDSQKEIVLANGASIEAYDLSGEKIWKYQAGSDFKKLAYSKGFHHLGGIFASTFDGIYLFSFNGGYIFDVKIGNVRDFLSREDEIFVLAFNNQILRLGINNMEPERIYSNEENETDFEYVFNIYLAGDRIVTVGQRGSFQILELNGEIVGEDNLESEIVGSSYANLDYDRELNFPPSPHIRYPEIMVATQEGGVYVYSYDLKKKAGREIKPQEQYEINKRIQYATILPWREEKVPQKLLIVDTEGKLSSYYIFYHYCNVLARYNSGVAQYSTERYQESERSLKEIADEQGQNERTDKNREILRHYVLLEDAEEYLSKAREELLKPKREGEAKIEIGYSYFNSEAPDYKKAIDPLFEAYLKFNEANVDGRIEVYGSKTLNDLMIDIRVCIFHLLEDADVYYDKFEYEKALDYFLIVYPKMERIMGNPIAETENTEKLKSFGNIAKEYNSDEKVKKEIENCIAQLDKMSQDALKDGNLNESRRLNDKLVLAASIIQTESEKYQLRSEEIAAREQARNKKYIICTVISVLAIPIFIFCRKIKKRYDDVRGNVLLRFDRAVDQFAHKLARTTDFKDVFGLDEMFDYWANFKAYIILFNFEREMRKFIRDKLEEKFGNAWEKKGLSSDKFNEAKERRNQEMSKMPARDLSEISLLDYCDFPDLDQAIQREWDLFKDLSKDRQDVRVRFDNLYSLRKIVAHNRELSDSEFNDILSHVKWFFDRIL